MATYQMSYGTADQTITITLASLASSATAGRESTVISNTTDKFLDVLVTVEVTLDAGSPANDQAVYVFAYGTTGGTSYPDNITGADAAITFDSPTQLRTIGIIPTTIGGVAYRSEPLSIAAAFNGIMPSAWGIAVRNYSGVALDAGAAVYQGIKVTAN